MALCWILKCSWHSHRRRNSWMARVVNQRESQGFMLGDWALSGVTRGISWFIYFLCLKKELSLDHVSSFTCQRKYNSFWTYGSFNRFYDVNVVLVKVSRKNQVQLWILLCISGAQHQQGAECWWRESRGFNKQWNLNQGSSRGCVEEQEAHRRTRAEIRKYAQITCLSFSAWGEFCSTAGSYTEKWSCLLGGGV